MCQLLGMNCNTPTDIQFSFEGFVKRGGLTDEHADGWGVAFFEEQGARVFIDHRPAATSPVAELIRNYPIRSRNVIAHIRKATQGPVALQNCHPFYRELWGQPWVFAHNGSLENFLPTLNGRYQPIGDTDSELAFCYLLEQLWNHFGTRAQRQAPLPQEIVSVLQPLLLDVAAHGAFNMMLSNGKALYTFCSTNLYFLIRQFPFTAAHLVDCDLTVDFSNVTTANDRVAVIATTPLTDNECWTPYAKHEFKLFIDGLPQ
ncbi:MAG: class II glutamine amidotransferase [Burkholderiaceae bacterium]|jgi:predicted glutamine amidotransferase